MAAPCRKMASRSVLQLFCAFSRNMAVRTGFCQFSSRPEYKTTPKRKTATRPYIPPPYSLAAAVYLQRPPVLSADCSPIEQRFKDMIQQIEFEKSLLSDHEIRLIEDAERMRRKQSMDYDSDEEENLDQDIVLAQDMEDTWEQKFKTFHPAPRVRDEVDKDLTLAERCLMDSLVLLAQHTVGEEKLWLLPQTQWKKGETLRDTAERALASLSVDLKATFLGNAPCGVYKYKLPKSLRTKRTQGRKIFFFKAILSDSSFSTPPKSDLLWLKKSELQGYLKPKYLMKVKSFILDL